MICAVGEHARGNVDLGPPLPSPVPSIRASSPFPALLLPIIPPIITSSSSPPSLPLSFVTVYVCANIVDSRVLHTHTGDTAVDVNDVLTWGVGCSGVTAVNLDGSIVKRTPGHSSVTAWR